MYVINQNWGSSPRLNHRHVDQHPQPPKAQTLKPNRKNGHFTHWGRSMGVVLRILRLVLPISCKADVTGPADVGRGMVR